MIKCITENKNNILCGLWNERLPDCQVKSCLVPVPVFFIRDSESPLIFFKGGFNEDDIKLGVKIADIKSLQITLEVPGKTSNHWYSHDVIPRRSQT